MGAFGRAPTTKLATLIGITPSTISQVKINLIYPSLPSLFKMAEALAMEESGYNSSHPILDKIKPKD